ncbi:MAG: methyltransferase domain-containing protein [Gammaproteobacteria bacterium]|jgi:SAM-dependent methyltransferase|nr:methyltransferase domain-containing protein [Gammaproteobacteria bacterium]MBT7603244.1 methyltransferase domain-containing protein [Gammaproteobacteria bacterium]
MNFKSSEINNWYETIPGKINSKLILDTINKLFYLSKDKNIIYVGPSLIIKKLMCENYNFNSFYISSSESADLNAELQKLPFKEASVDCIILIHSLEIDENPHAVFREINRILAEDGQLVITGFNRVSFLGLYSFLPIKSIFKKKNYIKISRLTDWMTLFSYDIRQIFNINKIPPINNIKILNYFLFLNKNPFSKINFFGNNYVIFAKKKTFKYISVKNWHKKNNIILGKFSKPVIHNNYEK